MFISESKYSDNQKSFLSGARCLSDDSARGQSLQRKASIANNTGLPDSLKNGVESLSGYSLDDVRVHYNSNKPAAVQAYAYTQGTDIHIAPGQESCLPHEAWHVTQQMAGRVSPTTSIGGVAVNDDASLEHEADVMGARASTIQGNNYAPVSRKAWSGSSVRQNKMTSAIVQRESRRGNRRDALRDDEENIKSFAKKVYEVDDYKAGKHGHFKAKYTPSNQRLHVTLPVYFGDGMDVRDAEGRKERMQYFKDNVEHTWSNKYLFNFRRPSSETSTQSSSIIKWENVLNNTNVKVTVEEKWFSSNNILSFGNTFFNVKAVHGGSSVGKENVKLRDNSFRYGPGVLTIGSGTQAEIKRFSSLNSTAHEAGHMFGLGDEYRVGEGSNRAADGTHSTHYDMVKDFFDESYANNHAVMHDNTDSAEDREGTSVMRNGDTVKAHHYVTFADAMVQAIQKKYPEVPSQKAPNTRGDWEIK